jgi:nicotinamide-nucleotide amidase
MVPAAATVIQNRVGTAPVMLFERGDKLLISLPGVPYEMQYAMQHEIEPMLAARCKKEHYCCQNFIVAHFTESALAQYLNDFESKLPAGFGLAYLPTPGFVKLRLFFRDADSDLQFRQMTDKLKTVLRNHLLASEDISMPEILGKLLLEKKASIATAESCTGGAVAAAITQVAGASQYFKGSIIAYSNRVKNRLLSVPLEIIEKHGAVSPATAELMAKGAMTALQTDCSIAITGIAGPEGGTAYKPVGTVWISTRYKTSSQTKLYHCMGKLRSANIVRATNYALIQMIDMLLEKQSD